MERKEVSFGERIGQRRLKRDVSERRAAEAVKQERMRRVRGACEGLKEEGAAGGEEEQMRKMWCKSFSLRLRVSRPTALPRPCRDQLVENKFMHPENISSCKPSRASSCRPATL